MEKVRLVSEIDNKYAKDLKDMDKTTDPLKIKIYNKLIEKKAKEIKGKTEELKQKQKKEKADLNNLYKEKLNHLNQEEFLKECAEKLKLAIVLNEDEIDEYQEEEKDKIDMNSITLNAAEQSELIKKLVKRTTQRTTEKKKRKISEGYISKVYNN